MSEKKKYTCAALEGKDVIDVLGMDLYLDNLAAYWNAQREDRAAIRRSYDAMRKLGGAKGYKIPAHPIDDLLHLSTEDLAVEYCRVVYRTSDRCLAERRYIAQIGRQAYNLTVAQLIAEEHPELSDVLLPAMASETPAD